MVAVHEELVRPRVITAVEDLAARQASGVLEVTGNPSGAIYLDGGRIAFVRASWVPGLAARLYAACPALADAGNLWSGRDADDAAVAGVAVQRGYLTEQALHELIGSIVADAFLVLTVPLSAEASVTAIRFTSTRTYWTDMFPRFSLPQVRAEASRRAERMAQHGLAPTTAVRLRDMRSAAAVVTREQWAVACQLGDHASARDVAARRGAALTETLDCLASLARAGLCDPVRAAGRDTAPYRVAPAPVQAPARPAPAVPVFTPAAQPPPSLGAAPAPAPVMARPPAPPAPSFHAAPVAPVHHEPAVTVPAPGRQDGPPPAGESPAAAPMLPVRQGTAPDAERLSSRRAVREHFARADHSAAQPPSVDILRQVLSGLRKL